MPNPLPPTPPLDIDPKLRKRLDDALVSLGRLDSITALLPDKHLFLYSYVRKEAVLSSQIEGTQSTLTDLLLFEEHAALLLRGHRSTMSSKFRITYPLWSTEWPACATASRSPDDSSATSIVCSWSVAEGRGENPESFAARRTGSVGLGLVTHGSFRLHTIG
jgi:hypothetical protein